MKDNLVLTIYKLLLFITWGFVLTFLSGKLIIDEDLALGFTIIVAIAFITISIKLQNKYISVHKAINKPSFLINEILYIIAFSILLGQFNHHIINLGAYLATLFLLALFFTFTETLLLKIISPLIKNVIK